MNDLKIIWSVLMRGSLGYTCDTLISAENAPLQADAELLAAKMFPELTVISAHHVYCSDNLQPNEPSS